jgi:uncharacterized protein (TIGR03118 family)
VLTGCGGYGGGNSAPPPPLVSLQVQPTTVLVGQAATLSWTAAAGATCLASDAWTGSRAASGTETVTPTAAGTLTYALACTGASGAYGNGGTTTRTVTLTVTAPSAFSKTSLVTDTPTGALADPHLTNTWGLAFAPNSPAWVVNNHGSTATIYDGRGKAASLVVDLPGDENVGEFAPTGLVFNDTEAFAIGPDASAAPAVFLFAGESGRLAGWTPVVDLDHALPAYAAADGAVYKGLAIARDGDQPRLYATDFHNAKIDVFDGAFHRLATSADAYGFSDPDVPAGYAPFGVRTLPTGATGAAEIYVTYARQAEPDREDDVAGPGLGLVAVFDPHGRLLRTLVAPGGALNAPWGLALAPADFGTFPGALLVGNFGDGSVHAFDAHSGAPLGALRGANGQPFVADGLWAIAFGNDHLNQPHTTLFYTAGPNDETNGAYGRLDLGASPPNLHAPPVVTLSSPAVGEIHGTVTVRADVTASAPIARVEFFAAATRIGTATSAPYAVQWDTSQRPDGGAVLTARALDVDGNVDTSMPVAVTVNN